MNRRLVRIAGIFVVIAVGLLAGIYGYISSREFMAMAAEKGATIAGDILSTKVDVGLVKVDSLNSLEIQDVALYDKNDKLIAQVAEAKVDFSYLSMLKNSPAEGVREVSLQGVEANIQQRADGSWNFSDLISKEPSESKFTGKVHIKDAAVRLGFGGNELLVDSVNADLDFDGYPAVNIKGSGKNQGTDVSISANVGGERQTFDVEVKNLVLDKYVPLVPQGVIPEDMVKDIGGTVPKFVVAGEMVGSELYYTGQIELVDGTVTVLDTRVENINGLATFNEKEAQVFMAATTAGQEATARGKIKLVEGKPVLDLTVASAGFEPGVVVKNIPYQGPVEFSARVTGDAENPMVDADVKIKNARFQNYAFTNCSAKVRYDHGAVQVNRLAADALGGHITGSGDFDAKTQAFVARVKIDEVAPSELAGEISGLEQIDGTVSADLLLSGNINEPAKIKASGNIESSGMGWKGIEADHIRGAFSYADNAIHVDFLSATLANGGEVGLQGDMTLGDKLDITFYGANVDMSLVKNIDDRADVYGFADIKGRLWGTLEDPKIRASFAAREGSLFSQPFDRLHGRAGGSLRGVKISDLVVEKNPDNIWRINGVVGFAGERRIKLTASTKGARMENMLKAIDMDFPLTGSVDNELEITGTVDNPQVVGHFSYNLGKYNDEIVIQSITGSYTYSDDVLLLKNVDLVSPGIQGHIDEGRVSKDGQLDIKMVAKHIDMEDFSGKLPLPISGLVDFEGQLTGNLKYPYFHGVIKSQDLAIRGEGFDEVVGNIDYRNHIVYLSDTYMKKGDGKFTLQLEHHINYRTLTGHVAIENGDVRSLGVMAGWERNNISGKLNGDFNISGTIDTPRVDMSAFVVDGKLGEYGLDDVSCRATLNNRVIENIYLSGREGATGQFSAQGMVDLDGDLSITADATQIDAGALLGAAGYSQPITGKIDCHMEAKGELKNPTAKVELLVNELGAYGASVDTMKGKFLVKDKVVSIVDELVANKQVGNKSNRVVATGRIPLAALEENADDDGKQIDLKISLDDADLSLLPTISSYIDWAVGETDGRIDISGTLTKPHFDGSLSVADGAYKIKGVEKPVTGVAIKVVLDDDQLTLEKCVGSMGGGTYTMTGYLKLNGLTPVDYHFDADINKLDVRSSFYQGDLTSTVVVDSQAMPAETIGDTTYGQRVIPKISGNLLLENVILSTPSLPESSSKMPEIALDYGITLGKDVRFISANLGNMRLVGNARFEGTTLRPKTAGAITVRKGTINYLKTTFGIMEGAIKFDRYETLFPSITLRAGTKVGNTRVFVSLTGPVEHMRFRLMSSPQMSEQEIIQLLTLRSDYSTNRNDSSKLSSMFSVGLQMTILSEVETAMRNVLNLDLFSVERDTAEFGNEKTGDKNYIEVYNVKMGKNLSEKFMLLYTKSVNADRYKAGFEYELTDNMSFVYNRDEKSANTVGVRAMFRFSTASPRDDVDDERIYRDNMGYHSVRR